MMLRWIGRTHPVSRLPWAGALALVLASPAAAQQVNVKQYDVRDGLAHDMVTSLLEDSKGYLWAGTFEGLSRFDGYNFVSYNTADGLGTYVVNDLAEDHQGRLWVATNGGGVSRLNDARQPGQPTFSTFLPGPGAAGGVNVLAVAADGRLWCGTDTGVYVAEISDDTPTFTHVGFTSAAVTAAAAHGGRVWMGVTGVGIVEFHDGRHTIHPVPWVGRRTRSIVVEKGEALLVASDTGLYRFTGGVWQRADADLRPDEIILHLLPDGSGGVWLATTRGLAHYSAEGTKRYPLDRGLTRLVIDGGGSLWAGLHRGGLASMKPRQIVTYTPNEGLPDADATVLLQTRDGDVLAITRQGAIAVFDEERASVLPGPRSPAGDRTLVQDGRDGWWALTPAGLVHLPGAFPDTSRQSRVTLNVEPALSLPSSAPLMRRDQDGALWFGTQTQELWRVSHPASPEDRRVQSWPLPLPPGAVSVLGIDRSGGVWVANMITLGRFADGRLSLIDPPDGLPQIQPRAFHLDSRGQVWIGLRFGGVLMTTEPSADRPRFVRYTMRQGLASDTVWAIAEDAEGMIYLGTGRGLDQLDPDTGRVRHFSTADGLAANIVSDLLVDRSGALWLAGAGGVSRITLPLPVSAVAPAPTYITRLELAGLEHPLPERGASALRDVELHASARHLRIQFVTPSFRHVGRVRYQYMLEGTDPSWSTPSAERTATYANLRPGRYRFQVRAVTDGRTSETPAVIEFVIHRPYYARGWFVALLLVGVTAGGLTVQRARQQRRRSLDAVRRQVATDLHDDVGSGLAQIAILSEVVKRDAPSAAAPALSTIADLARSLRDAMSDIVWAIDPDRDVPVAVVERMRQVTFNLLSPSTNVEFRAPEDRDLARVDLPPDRRRHLLLIFKEALTNVARHANATDVSIRVAAEPDRLVLTVRDNGAGFDPHESRDGHGLDSVSHRARSIGADLAIESQRGRGTVLTVVVPLRRRTRIFGWLPRLTRRA